MRYRQVDYAELKSTNRSELRQLEGAHAGEVHTDLYKRQMNQLWDMFVQSPGFIASEEPS